MKQLILFLFSMFLLISMQAQVFQPTSALTIFSEDGKRFFLVLNGERQNEQAETNIRVEELNQPYYSAKIIFEDKTIQEVTKKVLMVTDVNGTPQDVTYKLKSDKKGKQILRYFSSLPVLPNMPPPARMQDVSVYNFGTHEPQEVTTTRTTTTRNKPLGDRNSVGISVNGMGVDVRIEDPEIRETEVTTTTTRSNSHQETNQNQNYNSNSRDEHRPNNEEYNQRNKGCNGYPMSANDFQEAMKSIKSSGFDETRLSTAKTITNSNCLSTMQIMEICKAMAFEETKLDFAKYAYTYCTERKNYFRVSSIFSFESSKTDLNDYINTYSR